MAREKQLLIDFLCASAGGSLLYTGRDLKTTHVGMRIDARDWATFMGHVRATLGGFSLPAGERDAVLGSIDSLRPEIVEA